MSGSNYVKIIDAMTGALAGGFQVRGKVVNGPFISGDVVSITYDYNNRKYTSTYQVPSGRLISTL